MHESANSNRKHDAAISVKRIGRVSHEGSIGVRLYAQPNLVMVIIVEKGHQRVAQVIASPALRPHAHYSRSPLSAESESPKLF